MQEHREYRTSSRRMIELAESGFFGAPLKQETKHTVGVLMRCIYWADYLIDTSAEAEKEDIKTRIVRFLKNESAEKFRGDPRIDVSMADLKGVLQGVTCSQQKSFFDSVYCVYKHGKNLSKTKDPKEFVSERTNESIAAAMMFLSLAKELGKNKCFPTFFCHLSVSGSLVDSFIDAEKDHKNGEIVIDPLTLRRGLLYPIVCSSIKTFHAHPFKASFARYSAKVLTDDFRHNLFKRSNGKSLQLG